MIGIAALRAMKSDIPNLLLAGTALACMEIAATMTRGGTLFLSLGERLLYALTAASVFATAVLAVGVLVCAVSMGTRGARVGQALCALGASAAAATLLWLLSEGRRVRELSARTPVVATLAVLAGVAAWCVLRAIERRRRTGKFSALPWAAAAPLAAGCVAASALVLPRSYPAFHVGLALLATCAMSVAGALSPRRLSLRQEQRALWLAAGLPVLAPLLLARLAAHPTASFAVRESAPWSARVLPWFEASARSNTSSRIARRGAPKHSQAGVDLRDRDLLLITIDALRADLLRVYGGHGRTPELDRLADESAVFMRAYTPAPHTSYALASLLTGKFVKPLIELGEKLGDPPTVPDRLRRYGYRTAAFYPPAIFFVDGASFGALAARGFGFEYRKEMFSSARERVGQLADYLAQADPKRPLFVWVHLFEPHEPYEPPAELAGDGSERARYEGEVAACDRALPDLVRTFRAARPGATVVVTADHGEEFGDHGGSFHGTSLYDEQARVPLLWSSPGTIKPRRIATPVELTDLGTTILSTAAVPRDAHMRGDDLSSVLAGHDAAGPLFAFSSIDARHMITDGRVKAICGAREAHCALFELGSDRGERHNLSGAQPELAAHLRAELDRFLASISRTEAVTVSAGVGLPEPLARAKLGGSVQADELIPLLADVRPAVRAEAARELGELGEAGAAPALARVRAHDDDDDVRAEAAIASARLGDDAPLPELLALLAPASSPNGVERTRRAALALARFKRSESANVLGALVADERATEVDRVRAVHALGELGSPLGVEPLIGALSVVRLREASAQALRALGGARAADALAAELAQERYPAARRAEAEALCALGDARCVSLVRRFLGMASSLPGGVALLAAQGALSPSSRQGALLADAQVRRGAWSCADGACRPEPGARVQLPARSARIVGPVRVTLWFRDAEPGDALLVDGERFGLATREGQVSFERPSSASAEQFALTCVGRAGLVALAVVSAEPEIPPPAPEPWDAGVEEAVDAFRSAP